MTAKGGSSGGFSIVEVMVVLAIVAGVALIAVPDLISQLPRYRLAGAARQVMGDLMWARMQAVTQRNEFRFIVVNSHCYQILDDDDNDGTAGSGEVVRVRDISRTYPDVVITHTANPIFYPRGSASMGTITLTNAIGTKKLRIHITGRVKEV